MANDAPFIMLSDARLAAVGRTVRPRHRGARRRRRPHPDRSDRYFPAMDAPLTAKRDGRPREIGSSAARLRRYSRGLVYRRIFKRNDATRGLCHNP
jgi:hypothetical protein